MRCGFIIVCKVSMNHGKTRKTITLENQPFPHRPCFNTATVCKHEVTRNKSHLCIYRPLCAFSLFSHIKLPNKIILNSGVFAAKPASPKCYIVIIRNEIFNLITISISHTIDAKTRPNFRDSPL